MKDCKWLRANLEAYFCEALDVGQMRLALEHVESCADCRREIQSLREIDPLVKQLFDHRMALAHSVQSPHPRRVFALALGGAGVVAAGVLAFALLQKPAPQFLTPDLRPPAPPLVSEEPVKKAPDSQPILRAKPDAGKTASPQPAPAPVVPADAPDFVVVDPAGYSTTLANYRGYALLFGVWSAEKPETAQGLERVYHAFGTNTKLRILGVSNRRQDRLPGTTFPIAFNSGSRLLGATNADFILVDPSGNVRLRSKLTAEGTALIGQIRGQLEQMGIR